MKKKIYSLLMLAMAAFAFTSCEDVPMPYDMPGSAAESDEPLVQVVGDGTVENPYNVAGALYLITEGKTTDEDVAVEGIISQIDEIDTGSFGNATYYISDDGTTAKQLQVYRGYYLNGDRFKDKAAIKVGDKVIVSGKLTYHNQKTPEFAQGSSIYSLNGEGGGSVPAGEAKGSGTQADPFNVAAAIVKCKEIGTNPSTEKYYVKGTAVDGATADDSFNNITFDIADTEGGAKFKCFQVKGTNGDPLPAGFAIKKGDEVVVYGPIYNYSGNTPETAGKSAAYLVTVNGKATGEGGGSDTPQPTNTSSIDNPYTVAKALETANALSDNQTTNEDFYIKGKVSRKANTADEIGPNSSKKYSDMNYYISDDGKESNELYVYRGKYLDGADFTAFDQLKEGDEVIVAGQLQKYIDTKNGNAVILELKNSKIVKLNGQGSSGEQGGGGGDDTPETGTNGGFEEWSNDGPVNWVTASTAGNAKLSMSQVAHSGKYSVEVEGSASGNRRLAYKELKLKAGKYQMRFYAMAGNVAASIRPGFVPVTNGSVGSYKYQEGYIDLNNNEWMELYYEFTIENEGTYCIVIMNSKTPGQPALIDDVTLFRDNTQIIK